MLMKGRYPVCCLFLEMDPATVDVNIHPAKREVKFHNEREVRRLTAQAVREALLQFHSPSTSATPGTVAPVPSAQSSATFASRPSPAAVELPAFTPLTGSPLTAWTPPRPAAS